MKTKLLITGIIPLFFFSCIKNDFSDVTPPQPGENEKVELMTTIKKFQVPVMEGHITTVSCNGMLLARTSEPLTIQVPNGIVTKSNNVAVTYAPGKAAQSFSNLWQTVIFEDSKAGDFDYNDIVLHVNYQISGSTLNVKIHPIAMGSTKQIKVGYIWQQNGIQGEVAIAENIREELFGGELGIINTFNYDVKYPSFVNETSVSLPNSTDAVDMSWFIEIDNGVRLYAINQIGRQCIDASGFPYGVVLTNVGSTSEIKKSKTKEYGDDSSDWESIRNVYEIENWAFMPEQPNVPAGATDIFDEKKLWAAADKNYVVKAGTTFAEYIGFKGKDQTIYVQGTLTIPNTSDKYNIVVLPSGKLIIPNSTTIQNVNIHNYGTLELGETLNIGNKAEFKTNQDFIFPNMKLQLDKSLFYVEGDVELSNFEVVNNTEEVYVASLLATKIHVTNNTKTYVNGSVTADDMELNAGGEMYVDCSVRVVNKLYLTNNAELSVRSYVTAANIETTSSCELNIKSGALVETKVLKATNISSSSINVIGSAMGVVLADKLELSGGNDLGKYLQGNMGVVTSTNLKDFKLPGENVVFNSNEISVPENECSPGYNTNLTDNGIAWFAYPLEGIHIETCYDFEAWQRGDFDFNKLHKAKVFNIFDTNPRKGEKVEVYKIIE